MEDLTQIMSGVQTYEDNNLLVGYEHSDDAGVYRINDEVALVQSVDFITPIVDDPFIYGQIAASNALSDIFAMGAVAKTAMNLLMWDQDHISKEMISDILKGGAQKLKEARAVLLGGHSVGDLEQKYGLSVSGVVHPQKIWRNHRAQIGDVLVLCKALGTGIVSTALKNKHIAYSPNLEAIESMTQLNLKASLCAREFDIHACTDITGFGLVGHLLEMCADNKSAQIFFDDVPLFDGLNALIHAGQIPNGSKKNYHYLSQFVDNKLQEKESITLFDAQTSGGLLFALPKDQAPRLVESLRFLGYTKSAIIGEFIPLGEKKIVLDYFSAPTITPPPSTQSS
ncbi:selenide, water dikinase SelD [Helicobacter cholecystus]|uniref:selenide, water dikinase SelD n=1 Tax=Helicobacter cholecystus TaxID=45498 RepID=UPI002738BCAE|nr:selenide, water dikinase SelD [Helicobacter cholecystus]